MKATAIYNEDGTISLVVLGKATLFETVSSMVNHCKSNGINITQVTSNMLVAK